MSILKYITVKTEAMAIGIASFNNCFIKERSISKDTLTNFFAE